MPTACVPCGASTARLGLLPSGYARVLAACSCMADGKVGAVKDALFFYADMAAAAASGSMAQATARLGTRVSASSAQSGELAALWQTCCPAATCTCWHCLVGRAIAARSLGFSLSGTRNSVWGSGERAVVVAG